MTFLRVMISLVFVALGAIWTVKEHLQQPFYEVNVEIEPHTPKSLGGWERRSVLKEAWNEYVKEREWDVERTRAGYRLMLSEGSREELDTWLSDWNSAELARAQLSDGDYRRKKDLRDRQIERLNQRRESLLKLEADLKGLEEKAPQWSKRSSDLGLSKFATSAPVAEKKDESKPAVEGSIAEASSPEGDEASVTLTEDPDSLFRERLSDEVNRAQSFLSQGQKDLEEKLLAGQTEVVNRVARRLASQEQRLLTLLEQQLQSLENQDRHWEESRKMVGLLLGDQLAGLELELGSLKQFEVHSPSKATLSLGVKGIEAPVEALRDSFRFFLLGMVICFVFNLLWEMVVQRDRL
jgi:hypothetical protein